MKLFITRSQHEEANGVTFTVTVRVEVTTLERALLDKYSLPSRFADDPLWIAIKDSESFTSTPTPDVDVAREVVGDAKALCDALSDYLVNVQVFPGKETKTYGTEIIRD